MPLAISSDQFRFFNKFKFIELGPLFSTEVCQQVKESATDVISRRLRILPSTLFNEPFDKQFLKGRYLWEETPLIHKMVVNQTLGKLIKSLVQKAPIRLGFDQLISTPTLIDPSASPSILTQTLSLKETCSFQGVLMGLVINLGEPIEVFSNTLPLIPLAKETGSAIFFTSDIPLDFLSVQKIPGLCQLFITFTESSTQYIHQKTDPLTHLLKARGYVYGDPLQEKTHPTLIH